MRPEIWYREELEALLSAVEQVIHSIPTPSASWEQMIALGHLHRKLTEQIKTAPLATTPEAAA